MKNLYLAKALKKKDIIVSQEVIGVMSNWTNGGSVSRVSGFTI